MTETIVVTIGDSADKGVQLILRLLSNRQIQACLMGLNVPLDDQVRESLAYIVNHFAPQHDARRIQIYSYPPLELVEKDA